MAEGLAQEVDVIDEKTQAALSQIGREEKAAAADRVSPIVRYRASVAQLKVMGFAKPVIGPDPLAQPMLRAYFSDNASPLKSRLTIRPSCSPLSASTAPLWLVRMMACAPLPAAAPAPPWA
jgi:hypothetical protein